MLDKLQEILILIKKGDIFWNIAITGLVFVIVQSLIMINGKYKKVKYSTIPNWRYYFIQLMAGIVFTIIFMVCLLFVVEFIN